MSDILVVVDDSGSWEVLLRRLNAESLEADVALTAEDAQIMMKSQHYRLVIIDFALPGMDGWRLNEWILKEFGAKAPLTVALTGYYEPIILKKAIEAGFVNCFAKPTTQQIVRELKKLYNQKIH